MFPEPCETGCPSLPLEDTFLLAGASRDARWNFTHSCTGGAGAPAVVRNMFVASPWSLSNSVICLSVGVHFRPSAWYWIYVYASIASFYLLWRKSLSSLLSHGYPSMRKERRKMICGTSYFRAINCFKGLEGLINITLERTDKRVRTLRYLSYPS